MNRAATIDGMPVRMSTQNDTIRPTREPRAYSTRNTAPSIATGTAATVHSSVITTEPYTACRAPPRGEKSVAAPSGSVHHSSDGNRIQPGPSPEAARIVRPSSVGIVDRVPYGLNSEPTAPYRPPGTQRHWWPSGASAVKSPQAAVGARTPAVVSTQTWVKSGGAATVSGAPFTVTVTRIHNRGARASAAAAHTSTVMAMSTTVRRPAGLPRASAVLASSTSSLTRGGGAGVVVVVVMRSHFHARRSPGRPH